MNLIVFITVHTVSQSSQQGNDTSVQHIPIVVEAHDVTVEHPAELQPQPAPSEPMMSSSYNSLTNTMIWVYLSSVNAQVLCLDHFRAAKPIWKKLSKKQV